MVCLLKFAIICSSVLVTIGEKARFDKYRIYSIKIENEKQLEVLQQFEGVQDGLTFIEAPTMIGHTAEMLVPPHKLADISDLFEKFDLKTEIKTNNVQRLIDGEQPKFSTRASFGWKKYYDLNDIYNWIDQMIKRYPNELTNYDIGKSYEERTIRAVKFSRKSGNPVIFIESTIHAREWITAATATYILNELVTSNDPDIKELADNYDWVFVPVVNVDGYAYTHSKNRMWRKSRIPNSLNPFCIGVDQNRNFDFHHGENGASTNPCSQTYPGPKPLSEPETQALAAFIKSFDNIKVYLSFHSYGQMLLYPYGNSKTQAANYEDLNQIGERGREAIQKRFGTKYTVGSISDTIYLVSGSTVDWVYETRNVSLAYAFEFRDAPRGRYGFLLPANYIIPNAEETIDGLKAMIKKAKSLKAL